VKYDLKISGKKFSEKTEGNRLKKMLEDCEKIITEKCD